MGLEWDAMNALLITAGLLFVIVGVILAVSHEFVKGGNAAKDIVTLVVLSGVSGYLIALASGSL
jgi:uncharacterized membrane protein